MRTSVTVFPFAIERPREEGPQPTETTHTDRKADARSANMSLVDLWCESIQNGLGGNDTCPQGGAGEYSQWQMRWQDGEVQQRAQQQGGADDDGKTTLTGVGDQAGENACRCAGEVKCGLDRACTASCENLWTQAGPVANSEEIEHEYREEEGKP